MKACILILLLILVTLLLEPGGEPMKKSKKSYTVEKVEENLSGMTNHITAEPDIETNPFPFTEEDYRSNEQYHYGAVDSKKPI